MARPITLFLDVVLAALFAAAPVVARQSPAAPDPEAVALAPGPPIERPLVRGDEHRYRLDLAAGEYAGSTVQQQGVDVVVRTEGPDGATIAEFQDAIGGRGVEQIDLVATIAGAYSVIVTLAPGVIAPGAYTIRTSEHRQATDDDRAMQESRSLRTAAARLNDAGRLSEARPLFERALALGERVRGSNDAYVIGVVRDLADNALEARDDARAEPLYRRALANLQATRGADDPETAFVQSRLAVVYERAGERPKAEALVRQALDVIERTLGADHLSYVRGLVTLSVLRNQAGDIEKAEEINRRAVAILETLHETDGLLYAGLLNNLGDLARQKGDFAAADDFLRRALAMNERLRGPDSYSVSTTLQNLGIVARERKDYAVAAVYARRALAIREALEGPQSPAVAQLLMNLGNIYRATGDVTGSLETQFRALHILEAAAGPYERGVLLAVGNIARTYASIGDLANAIEFQRRTDALVEAHLALNLAVGSEREKLAFARSMAERTDRTISLHLDLAPADADAAALAALVVLQRKGRVLDAMADTFAAARQRMADAPGQALLDELRAATAQVAQLALDPRAAGRADERRQRIDDLEARRERLEADLSARSAEFRAEMQPVTLQAVQGAIPADAALVEFAVFRPFDPRAERNAEAYGPPHYAAYVLRRSRPAVGRDLGPAAAIDHAIDALRQALRDPGRADVKALARDVDERVMRPLRASIGEARRLLVSPDGRLNLVPFEALVDERGHYLIDRYGTSYLTSGRDLLRLQVARESRTPPVIVADPFFGEPPAPSGIPPAESRRNANGGVGASATYFAPLAGALAEARAIKALFPSATLVTGRDATKTALERLEAPQILHIASHGFFDERASHDVENPLLWSGLALAGANLDAQGDGVLTALEASSLNLWGTRLVSLSGCDTGLGEVRNGEGVYGLRRAFVLAGTETLVMSLWPVGDGVAREMMTTYYASLRAGLGRGDALRRAKLAIRQGPGRAHPFYWASFIQSGEWAGLDGKR